MAESNANDTAEVAKQAGLINEMVDEISRLLTRGDEVQEQQEELL